HLVFAYYAGQRAVLRSVRENRPLGLQIAGDFDGQASAPKQFIFLPGGIHGIEQVAGREQGNGVFFMQVTAGVEDLRLACRDSVHLRRTADSDNSQGSPLLLGDSFACRQETKEWLGTVQRAYVADAELIRIW